MSNRSHPRIAFLTSFPNDVSVGSGVVRMISGYVRALQKLNVEADFIHARFHPKSYLNLAVRRLLFNKHLNLHDYDIVIGSDFDGFSLTASRPPKIVLNGGILADIVRFEQGRIQRILRHLALRECQNVRSAAFTVVPSQYTAQKVQELYGISREHIRIIPPGINYAYWQNLLATAEKADHNPPTILCVAKHYPRKGIADLIEALPFVIRAVPGVRLSLVGGGPQFEFHQELARQRGVFRYIEFVGDVNDDARLARYYRKAQIFCLPTYHETFGIVFLEAMAAGLPVVAYRSTAVPEVVSPNEGLLTPVGDIARLAQNLVTLLLNRTLREQMGAAGRRKVRQFSWQASAQELLRLLHTVLPRNV